MAVKIEDLEPILVDIEDNDYDNENNTDPAVAAAISVAAAITRRQEQQRAPNAVEDAVVAAAVAVAAADDGTPPPPPPPPPPSSAEEGEPYESIVMLLNRLNAQINYIDQYVGINLPTSLCILFMTGEMAGVGMLATPWAVTHLGYKLGFAMLLIIGFIIAYSGTLLGKCWTIIDERFYQYRVLPWQNPYKRIAEVAFGKEMSYFTTACIQTTLFGTATVLMMLLVQTTQRLFFISDVEIDFNTGLFIFTIVLSSLMFFEDPRELRVVAVGTMVTTMSACFLIVLQMLLDSRSLQDKVSYSNNELNENQFFLMLGAIIFSFGVASTIPTIQNERYKRYEFSRSITFSYTVLSFLFGLVVAGGYIVYGDDVKQNILLSLGNSSLSHGAIILIMGHLMLAFIITVNPISRHFEIYLDIPDEFSLRRFLLRMCLLLGMVFIAQCVRDFNIIMALIGGTTITFTTFVLPPIFYMRLCAMQNAVWPNKYLSWISKILMCAIIITGLGIIGFTLKITISHFMDLKALIRPYMISIVPTEK